MYNVILQERNLNLWDTKFSSEFASQIRGCYVNLSVQYGGVSMFKILVNKLQSKSDR